MGCQVVITGQILCVLGRINIVGINLGVNYIVSDEGRGIEYY